MSLILLINIKMLLKINKFTLFLLIYATNIDAYEINPLIYKGILHNECLKIKNQCYPFVLRANSKHEDIDKILLKENVKMKSNIIDCKNKSNCIRLTNMLVKYDITNIDLGPFQINYYHNKNIDLNKIFHIESAKFEVKVILKKLIDKYGYSWKTIGRYHSFKETRNQEYYLKMYKYFLNNNML